MLQSGFSLTRRGVFSRSVKTELQSLSIFVVPVRLLPIRVPFALSLSWMIKLRQEIARIHGVRIRETFNSITDSLL